ncbi:MULTISPECIES: MFS transporter [Vagococcus]|uniref:Cyanate permease n=1 Tax=Vagococcus fluvialis bH819 TaxID=1255619 RepID=A0A1X6WJQ2_9ENTE|nr:MULTISPECIES: MFS transporter [Vagococcus]SLM84521.1 Cyanate permease [Vagococcus fluvialis bH819]HCM90015.1 MFS transporter [Vagococcus sp.]
MKKKIDYILLLGIILVATNLRAPITSVGPLSGLISKELSLSGAQAGLITTIPLLSFALISPLAPKFAKRFGMERTIFASLILLIIGMSIRYVPSIPTLFLGTMVLGCAIAVSNVLLPGLVKKEFYQQGGLVTGLYSVSMSLSGAIASGVSIPLVNNFGLSWNQALSLWALLACVAFLGWLPQVKKKQVIATTQHTETEVNLWKSPLAWSVTLFMGIQSLIFYVLVAWLPTMLISQGMPTGKAGGMLSLLQVTLLPVSFIMPMVIEKRDNQRSLAVLSFVLFFLGIGGLMFTQTLIIGASVIGIGIAGGVAFSLSMMFFNLRTSSAGEASELSGMAQSVGYLLAATGPFLFGLLHDTTNNWHVPLYLLLGFTVVLLFVGLKAGKREVVK